MYLDPVGLGNGPHVLGNGPHVVNNWPHVLGIMGRVVNFVNFFIFAKHENDAKQKLFRRVSAVSRN